MLTYSQCIYYMAYGAVCSLRLRLEVLTGNGGKLAVLVTFGRGLKRLLYLGSLDLGSRHNRLSFRFDKVFHLSFIYVKPLTSLYIPQRSQYVESVITSPR